MGRDQWKNSGHQFRGAQAARSHLGNHGEPIRVPSWVLRIRHTGRLLGADRPGNHVIGGNNNLRHHRRRSSQSGETLLEKNHQELAEQRGRQRHHRRRHAPRIRTVLKIAAWGLFFTAMFGLSYIRRSLKSSECRDATETFYQHIEVKLLPWWLPGAGNLPTQEEMEEIKELAAQSENRRTQAGFRCQRCGHQANADANAAEVIRRRGLTTQAREGEPLGVPPEPKGAEARYPLSGSAREEVLHTGTSCQPKG